MLWRSRGSDGRSRSAEFDYSIGPMSNLTSVSNRRKFEYVAVASTRCLIRAVQSGLRPTMQEIIRDTKDPVILGGPSR